MESTIPTRKLFRLALLTSPVIGLLAIGTVSIVPYFFLKNISLSLILLFAFFISSFIFLIWTVNIGLTLRLTRAGQRPVSKRIRYLLSYVAVLLPILVFRLLLSRVVNEQAYINLVAPGKSIYIVYLMRFCILFSVNTIILILQDLVLIRENKAIVDLENSALRLKNMEALNQQLKQQIHPHFLFNSLNTLKALINRDSERAGDYLVKLSDYLRTSISFGKANTVSLREELKLSTDYLDMQKMRFGEALHFQIDLPEEKLDSVFLPVLSLQLLLENAIKHNALTSEMPLKVRISYSENMITVTNNLQSKQTNEPSLGFGLANLNERYRILSGKEASISTVEGSFSVSIPILSQASSG